MATLAALFAPTNATEQVVELDDATRFVSRPGELYGQLQQRDAEGNWRAVAGQVRLDQLQGRAMLSDAERALIGAPLLTPADPQPTPPLVNPLPTDDRSAPQVPGYEAEPPAGPVSTTTPLDEPSWQDLLIERSASEKLGRSLEASGQSRPPGYEAHHIVPSSAGTAEMADLRARLQGLGIDLDSAVNGVWLPGPRASADAPEAYHRTLNNDAYNGAVVEALRDVNDFSKATSVLRDIADQLKTKTFPGIRPRP